VEAQKRKKKYERSEESKAAWFKMETFVTSDVLACLDCDGLVNLPKLRQECKPTKVYHFMPHLDAEASVAAMDAGIHPGMFHGKSTTYFTETIENVGKSPHLPKAGFSFRASDTQQVPVAIQLNTSLAFYEHIRVNGVKTMVVEFAVN
jgi:hypothetical protein